MQLTIDSREPLADVLRVVGGLYNVTLTTTDATAPAAEASSSRRGSRRSTPTSTRRRGRQSAAAGASGIDAKAVREWASSNGFEVSPRGALSAAVRQAYQDAHH